MKNKFLFYVKPETPKKNSCYSVGAVIAESEEKAIEIGNKTYGDNCKIVGGPYELSKLWR